MKRWTRTRWAKSIALGLVGMMVGGQVGPLAYANELLKPVAVQQNPNAREHLETDFIQPLIEQATKEVLAHEQTTTTRLDISQVRALFSDGQIPASLLEAIRKRLLSSGGFFNNVTLRLEGNELVATTTYQGPLTDPRDVREVVRATVEELLNASAAAHEQEAAQVQEPAKAVMIRAGLQELLIRAQNRLHPIQP